MEHQKVGEMFVVCGVLYAIDSVTTYHSKIRFALDLYSERLVEVNLDFTNPFESTTMVGYNHRKEVSYILTQHIFGKVISQQNIT